ncbi:MAG TPA: hypothetical protein VFH48_08965, partial [Chloroflexota bacterium]|nr:hypothetical protein [Chloroflexota bacterium]
RALARNGRRFETWADGCQAVAEATAYGHAQRHPFVWGRGRARRRRAAAPASASCRKRLRLERRTTKHYSGVMPFRA